jgi:tetratricopeptide (TPR) repeat protein
MTANVRPGDRVLDTPPRVDAFPRADRLESWKEIAAYLNRSERTVRRWEAAEGLPVHRLQHDKRGSVYAYVPELDAWRRERSQVLDAEPAEPAESAPVDRRRGWLMVAAVGLLAAAGVTALVLPMRSRPRDPGGTGSREAQRALTQGQFFANAGRVQVQTGILYFQEAIRLDPRFARAWEALATAHMAQTWFADAPAKASMALARREAERALQLAPELGGPWRVLGNVSHFLDWDHNAAERHFTKAIAIEPASAATAGIPSSCSTSDGSTTRSTLRAARKPSAPAGSRR